MLSPTTAPALALRITPSSQRSPLEARFPAVMTTLSLGTNGKNASIADTAKITA